LESGESKQVGYDPKSPIFESRYCFATRFIQNFLNGELKDKKFFDVGIGEGQLLEKLASFGAVPYGVDSSRRNSELLKQKEIPHYFGTIESYDADASVKKPYYDFATILFVLQNSQSATEMLRATYNLLREDGYLFIQMGSRIMVPFKKPMGTYFAKGSQDLQPYHFSIATLHNMLAKCGFKIVHTNNYWDDDLMFIIAQKQPENQMVKPILEDYMAVLEWFERWHAETLKMNEYIKFPQTIKYSFYEKHSFYDSIKI